MHSTGFSDLILIPDSVTAYPVRNNPIFNAYGDSEWTRQEGRLNFLRAYGTDWQGQGFNSIHQPSQVTSSSILFCQEFATLQAQFYHKIAT